jgi:hypothetical protein
LKVERVNGRNRVMVPDNFMADKLGSPEQQVAEAMQAARMLESQGVRIGETNDLSRIQPAPADDQPNIRLPQPEAPEIPRDFETPGYLDEPPVELPRPPRHETPPIEIPGYDPTPSPHITVRTRNFTIAETDAAPLVPVQFQQAPEAENDNDERIEHPSLRRDGSVAVEVREEVPQDRDWIRAKRRQDVVDRRDRECNCSEWRTEWTATKASLVRVIRGSEEASVPTRNPAPDERGRGAVVPIITIFDEYVFDLELSWTRRCIRSAEPPGCADGWSESGTSKATVIVRKDTGTKEGRPISYPLREGLLADRAAREEGRLNKTGSSSPVRPPQEVPAGDLPSGAFPDPD